MVKVKDDVTDSLGRSMGLWNSMMMSLSNRTSFNVNLIQQSQSNSMMFASQSSMNAPSQMNQSYFS